MALYSYVKTISMLMQNITLSMTTSTKYCIWMSLAVSKAKKETYKLSLKIFNTYTTEVPY